MIIQPRWTDYKIGLSLICFNVTMSEKKKLGSLILYYINTILDYNIHES